MKQLEIKRNQVNGNQIQTVVFDLDDTLIETGVVFRQVFANLCEVLKKRLKSKCPPDEAIIDEQNEIDTRLLPEYGARPERFAKSLILSYKEIVSRAGGAEDENDLAYLDSEGHRAFRSIPELSFDTLEVLDQLLHCELLLYTWGLAEIQLPRIRALELEKYFSQIHCVHEKSVETFTEILDGRSPKSTLMCGDSLKLDIAPAVRLGCHAAHRVRPHGWAYLRTGVEIDGPYHEIQNLTELVPIIAALDAQAVPASHS